MNAGSSKCSGKRVLVIDDDDAVADVIKCHLEEDGMNAFTAADTHAALQILSQHPVDAIILDISLPTESGLDFLPKLKKRYPSIPVVILTGNGYDHENIESAMTRGAATYFSKETGFENVSMMLQHIFSGKFGTPPGDAH